MEIEGETYEQLTADQWSLLIQANPREDKWISFAELQLQMMEWNQNSDWINRQLEITPHPVGSPEEAAYLQELGHLYDYVLRHYKFPMPDEVGFLGTVGWNLWLIKEKRKILQNILKSLAPRADTS